MLSKKYYKNFKLRVAHNCSADSIFTYINKSKMFVKLCTNSFSVKFVVSFFILGLCLVFFLRQNVHPHATPPTVSVCSYDVRKHHVIAKCSNNSMTLNRILTFSDNFLKHLMKVTTLLVDEEHRVLYCYAGKVGSSTFKSLFIRHSSEFVRKHGTDASKLPRGLRLHSEETWRKFSLRSIKSYSVPEARQMLQDFRKILTVRHPMARVHSFYKDKLRKSSKQQQHCFYIFAHLANLVNNRTHDVTNGTKCDVTFSFADFAEYFAQNPFLLRDGHLQPVVARCKPCLITYDYIFRLETAKRDQKFLLENIFRAGFSGELMHENKRSSRRPQKKNEADKQKFNQEIPDVSALNKLVFDKIQSYYAQDSHIFGYNNVLDSYGRLEHTCSIPEEKDSPEGRCC